MPVIFCNNKKLTTTFDSSIPIAKQNILGSVSKISIGEYAAHVVAVTNNTTTGINGSDASINPLFFPVPSRYEL